MHVPVCTVYYTFRSLKQSDQFVCGEARATAGDEPIITSLVGILILAILYFAVIKD